MSKENVKIIANFTIKVLKNKKKNCDWYGTGTIGPFQSKMKWAFDIWHIFFL